MPTSTFSIASDINDAYVYKSSGIYPPAASASLTDAGSVIDIHRSWDVNYIISNGLLAWNTSSLPDDATVQSAILRVFIKFKSSANSRTITADWGPLAFTATDYSETAQTGALSGVTITSLVSSATNDITLQNVSNISKTATTYLRLHVSGGQPTGLNNVQIASFADTFTEPQLIVTYGLGADLIGAVGI